LFITKVILQIVDPHKEFVVCIDASLDGLGGVLLQYDYAIAYESRKLKHYENNYATHDIELAIILHALRMLRRYMLGRRFLLKTGNISLNYCFGQHNLNSWQDICLYFLREYGFEIKYIKGKEKKIGDALSKKLNAIFSSNVQSNLKQRIKSTAKSDEDYIKLWEKFHNYDSIGDENKLVVIKRV